VARACEKVVVFVFMRVPEIVLHVQFMFELQRALLRVVVLVLVIVVEGVSGSVGVRCVRRASRVGSVIQLERALPCIVVFVLVREGVTGSVVVG
jgi:hypothetical protein